MGVTSNSFSEIRKVESSQVNKAPRRGGFSPRKITRISLLLVICYLLFLFSHGFYQAYELKGEIRVLEGRLSELKEENNKLKGDLKYMQSPEAVEKLAREKLGLIKPGEIIILKAKEAK